MTEPHKKADLEPQDKAPHQKIKGRILKGSIAVTSKGVGYFEPEGAEKDAEDIEIAPEQLATALHNDEVEVELLPKTNLRQGGRVIKIVERAKEEFVGVLDVNGKNVFLLPDDRKMYKDIYVSGGIDAHAKNGIKALVRITKWDDASKNPEGKIIQIIGKKGDNNVEMHSIVLEKGFAVEFPHNVEREAETLKQKSKQEMQEIASPTENFSEGKNLAGKRRDFRDTLTFTIDPVDAKDFDDAISFKKLEDGKIEIGVHIADVSHYVTAKTELDTEAKKRGFSVYLVDRTIPMLPEVLSNDICSLNPNEDKLTFSAVFIMDTSGKVHGSWYGKTIINSNKRFTYEEVQKILDDKSGLYFEELNTLNHIAKILQKEKFDKGAINFEQDEVKFRLDPNGKPIEVIRKVRTDSHKLVEEYMLLANRGVAHYLSHEYEKKGIRNAAMIYRIHDLPDPEKIADLTIFLKALGYDLESHNGKVTSKQISKVLAEIEGKPNESLIKTAAIRSMAKAVYSTRNVGHFGLAYDFYTHFTSPIRRYADLLVHRLLYRYLSGGKIEQDEIALYEKMASKSTEKEIAAAEAERASIKYKQVEYMQDKVGQIFDGTITGVTDWGIYIEEVMTRCEGMAKLRDLNDFYTLNQKTYSLTGEKTKKKFTLGDKVKFKIVKADLEAKTLDYLIV